MREIKLFNWKEPDPKDPKKEKNVDLIEVLKILIYARDPQKMFTGIDKHRFFGRLGKAFEKAEKTRVLELEEGDYSQLKKIVEEDVKGDWGLSKDINKAVEDFLGAEQKHNENKISS